MFEDIEREFREAVHDTDRARALEVVRSAVSRGVRPEAILLDLVSPTIEEMLRSVSGRFGANLAQHFMASQIAADIADELLGAFGAVAEARGRVVMGNAFGDFHGLGKRIVIGCLRARGFHTIDVGINVAPEVFVDAAVAEKAQVIGISSMMVHTAKGPKGCLAVRALLRERGLEKKIKIAVGGAPYRFHPELWQTVQADGTAEDGLRASVLIERLASEVES